MRYYWLYFRWLLVMCVAKPLGVGSLMTPWEALEAALECNGNLRAEYVIQRPPCQCADCVAARTEIEGMTGLSVDELAQRLLESALKRKNEDDL